MALLGSIPKKNLYEKPTRDLNSGPLYQLSYRDRGLCS